MCLREATTADAESIGHLVRELSEKTITKAFSPAGREALLASLTTEKIAERLESDYRYHVAESQGEIIGVVGIRDNKHLYHLFVAQSHQRQGLARKLWETAMALCLQAGNTGEFTVNSSHYAVPVYEKFGFVVQSGPIEKAGIVSIPMKLVL